jgi:hypothetical protein
MSFTSRDLLGWFHTFTSLPLVHTLNPDFLKLRLWLGFPQIPESFTHNSRISGVWTHNFASSLIPELCGFKIPDLRRFDHPATVSRFTRNSQIQLLFSHIIWKLISWNPANPTLRGCKVFPEFPNTSPSGKRVDSDDPIPRKLSNSGKKRHPRNVGVDTRPP